MCLVLTVLPDQDQQHVECHICFHLLVGLSVLAPQETSALQFSYKQDPFSLTVKQGDDPVFAIRASRFIFKVRQIVAADAVATPRIIGWRRPHWQAKRKDFRLMLNRIST